MQISVIMCSHGLLVWFNKNYSILFYYILFYSILYTQNMPGIDDRPSSIKGVREDIQVSKQQIY
jgi:hypothetical protein